MLSRLYRNWRTLGKGMSEGYTGEKSMPPPDAWDRLYSALANHEVLQGKVDGVENNDLVIFLGDGIKGVIPHDEIGEPRPKRLTVFVNAPVAFKVIRCNRSRNEIILSRKDALAVMSKFTLNELKRDCTELMAIQEQMAQLRLVDSDTGLSPEARKRIRELARQARRAGPVRTGTVRSVAEDGAYMDIGGVSVFLPRYEITWGKTEDARELIKPGESFDVKIIRADFETGWIRASLKSLVPDPWDTVPLRYVKDGIYHGEINSLTHNGNLVVELEPGVSAICPRVPVCDIKPGTSVRVRIAFVDPDRHFIRGLIAGESRWVV